LRHGGDWAREGTSAPFKNLVIGTAVIWKFLCQIMAYFISLVIFCQLIKIHIIDAERKSENEKELLFQNKLMAFSGTAYAFSTWKN
jgi:hypothetical protein